MMHVAQVRKVVKATRQAVHILGMSLGFRIIRCPSDSWYHFLGPLDKTLQKNNDGLYPLFVVVFADYARGDGICFSELLSDQNF